MPPFSNRWPTFEDYIIEITRQIWDDRDVLSLHHYYAADIIVRTPGGVTRGNGPVIRATIEAIGQTPHRSAGAEDVIWSRDETGHYYSSHRVCDWSVHNRDGVFGPATGRDLRYWIIADCAVRDEVIDDEWLVRDGGGLVRALDWHPRDFARHQIELEGGPEACASPLTAANDVAGPYTGAGNTDEWGAKYAEMLTRIMEGDLSTILKGYDEQCHLQYAGGIEAHGPDGANSFWAGLRSSFPGAAFNIHHTIGRHDPLLSPRAAVRWTLEGTHDGWGNFGAPTGAKVYMMGICHAEFGPRGLRREYALYDEVAVWKQILLQTGATAS